jgi:hypothetical protein
MYIILKEGSLAGLYTKRRFARTFLEEAPVGPYYYVYQMHPDTEEATLVMAKTYTGEIDDYK